MIATILPEFVHLVYHEALLGIDCVWLEEGLATFLSGQRNILEQNQDKFDNFLHKVLSKEIPSIQFLNKRGNHYGEFVDSDTNQYNGYDISYLLVKMLLQKYGKEYLLHIVTDEKRLHRCEKIVIDELLMYFF